MPRLQYCTCTTLTSACSTVPSYPHPTVLYHPIPSLLPILAHNGSVITISSDSNLHAGLVMAAGLYFHCELKKKSNFDNTESSEFLFNDSWLAGAMEDLNSDREHKPHSIYARWRVLYRGHITQPLFPAGPSLATF